MLSFVVEQWVSILAVILRRLCTGGLFLLIYYDVQPFVLITMSNCIANLLNSVTLSMIWCFEAVAAISDVQKP